MSSDVIVFENLRQRTNVIGQYSEVKVKKTKPFIASNATGTLRKIQGHEEVETLAKIAAQNTMQLLTSTK